MQESPGRALEMSNRKSEQLWTMYGMTFAVESDLRGTGSSKLARIGRAHVPHEV
jgi:hypothetical protein